MESAKHAVDELLKHLDPSNHETPVIGNIRKANKALADAIGDPLTYADKRKSAEERIKDVVDRFSKTFMGK
jgi:hypothetical protein